MFKYYISSVVSQHLDTFSDWTLWKITFDYMAVKLKCVMNEHYLLLSSESFVMCAALVLFPSTYLNTPLFVKRKWAHIQVSIIIILQIKIPTTVIISITLDQSDSFHTIWNYLLLIAVHIHTLWPYLICRTSSCVL